MNKRSLRILEFNKILSMVTEYATSPMAKRRVDRMKPQRDIEQIRKLQEETNDALNRLNRHGNISFSGYAISVHPSNGWRYRVPLLLRNFWTSQPSYRLQKQPNSTATVPI